MLRRAPTSALFALLALLALSALLACGGRGRPVGAPAEEREEEAEAQQAPPSPAPRTALEAQAQELVRRLVERRPGRMSELEAIVGPISMSFRDEDNGNMGDLERPRGGTGEFTPLVPRLWIEYAWDWRHMPPTFERDVGLETYTLEVSGSAAGAAEILRAALGPPRAVADGAKRYDAFHPFYLVSLGVPGPFRITWYSSVPRFAIPEPDPEARAAWLRALAHRIATTLSIDEVDDFCRAAPAHAGIKVAGNYRITFVPPVRALVVAQAFGWGDIVGVARDEHMSSWYLERRADARDPRGGAAGQWALRAAFVKHPTGGTAPRGTRRHTHFGVREVAPEDELATISIERRR